MTKIIIIILIVFSLTTYLGFKKDLIISKSNEAKNMQKNLIENQPNLPTLGKAPEIKGISSWINSDPLMLEKLKGKVILVDFWTYSCINCIRTLPYVEGWYEKYKDNGFVILGVHSPEFTFEKDKKNVESAVKKYGVTYPVALDNDHATWNAFSNQYWPAHYLVDKEGNIRYQHFGEGRYDETESAIQKLLLEARLLTIDKISEVLEPTIDTNLSGIGTPEIYLGYLRINNVGNMDEGVPAGKPFKFKVPEAIEKNKFYFSGTWTINPEFSEYTGNPSTGGKERKIIINYKANKLNMVLASNIKESTAEIKIDGKYLDDSNKGADITIENGISKIKVTESRLYNLINTNDPDWHIMEIIIKTPGFRAFTFTFG